MGIWIRSQNKKRLIDCTDIRISSYDIYDHNADEFLGTYKSEERALEVLSEIMQAIEMEIESTVEYNGATCRGYRVFQMPQK